MKPGTHLASILLAAVSLAHLLRIVVGVQVTVANRVIPVWLSGVVFAVTGGVAIMLWREARKKG